MQYGHRAGSAYKDFEKRSEVVGAQTEQRGRISKSYLDYIESGAREPQVDILKIAALKTPLAALLDIQKEQLETAIIMARRNTEQDSDLCCGRTAMVAGY